MSSPDETRPAIDWQEITAAAGRVGKAIRTFLDGVAADDVPTSPLSWHYGDDARMWCYDCGGEVWSFKDATRSCDGCGREEHPPAEEDADVQP